MNNISVLKLDSAWRPVALISAQKAVKYYQKNKIVSEIGETCLTFHGGVNKAHVMSTVDIKPIIVVDGKLYNGQGLFRAAALDNEVLFRRDNYTCAYCQKLFTFKELSRDHIIPRHQKGRDIWTNVVTACKPCNSKKANKTPEEAGMVMHAKPYAPTRIDIFLLKSNLLPEQKEFLANMAR